MAEYAPKAPQPQATATPAASQVVPAQEPLKQDGDKEAVQGLSIQRKLAIGAVDDPLEQEADAMADKVMRMPEQPFVQRKRPDCEEEIQRRPLAAAITPFIQARANKPGGCNKKTHKWNYEYDGCSLPDGIPLEWESVISIFFDKDNPTGGKDTQFANDNGMGPCDIHDECYQSLTSNKEDCDKKMLIAMVNVCRNSSDENAKHSCVKWAAIYYNLLMKFGDTVFYERKKQLIDCVSSNGTASISQPDLLQSVSTYASVTVSGGQKEEKKQQQNQNVDIPLAMPTYIGTTIPGSKQGLIPQKQSTNINTLQSVPTFHGTTVPGHIEDISVVQKNQNISLLLSTPTFNNLPQPNTKK
jgi:hypothetical protein